MFTNDFVKNLAWKCIVWFPMNENGFKYFYVSIKLNFMVKMWEQTFYTFYLNGRAFSVPTITLFIEKNMYSIRTFCNVESLFIRSKVQ